MELCDVIFELLVHNTHRINLKVELRRNELRLGLGENRLRDRYNVGVIGSRVFQTEPRHLPNDPRYLVRGKLVAITHDDRNQAVAEVFGTESILDFSLDLVETYGNRSEQYNHCVGLLQCKRDFGCLVVAWE